MPPYIPRHRELVYVSGVAEIAGGLATMHPSTRRAGSAWSIATLIAVFPGQPPHGDRVGEIREGHSRGPQRALCPAAGAAALHRLGLRGRRLGLGKASDRKGGFVASPRSRTSAQR